MHSRFTIDVSRPMADRYNHITDNELLAHYYADGNQEWIGVLLKRYTLLLLGVCMKYLKDESEAKDCVQQIFLKVLTEVPKYKIEYFKSWLYMVAKNHCLMRLRDRDKNVRELSDNSPHMHHESDKSDLLENEQTYNLLEEAITELSDEQKKCVILFYLQKQSYQQVADQTGFNMMQVKSYIQNGKRNLKILLERKLKEKRQGKR
ncbi:MAG TPA: sigma-70 family RNA polymerase sigma factor [Flavisolibacter sp.]|nr:sigma-70 family RNA polymerase sigma factor [Flavisolibacter sp.]